MGAEIKILAGPAGSGKSNRLYEELIRDAYRNRDRQFFLIVPEQAGSSMEQRILRMNKRITGRDGFFNIDIIGFTRLAYRVFQEQGRSLRNVMEDYGKTILLRAVIGRVRDRLSLYRGSVDRQGFVEELKSLFSEFFLFDISPEDLENVIRNLAPEEDRLKQKLEEILCIYREFREDEVFRSDYMVAEELPAYLARLLSEEGEIACVDGAVFVFDGFTGFTAEQRKVLEALKHRASGLSFSVTIEQGEMDDPLFGKSREMLNQLRSLSTEVKEEWQKEERQDRPEMLNHLTRHIFRFPIRTYHGPVDSDPALRIWKTANPPEQLKVVAEDIRTRVAAGELRYRDAAILTPDLEGLSAYLDPVMGEYDLPYFCDRTRNFINNPIIDAQLAILLIADLDFSEESVFSLVKTGILDHAVEEAGLDPGSMERLENFVMEHGIRGKKLWQKPAGDFVKNKKKEQKMTEMEEVYLEEIEEARSLIISVLSPFLRYTGRKEYPVKQMIDALLAISDDPRLRLEDRCSEAARDLRDMGYPADAAAYANIRDKYRSVLEKTKTILGNAGMTVHDLRETLLIGVREIKVGVIPPTLDTVLVGDLDRTRLGAVKYLYILDMNEGIFPRPKSAGGILSDRDRAAVGKQLTDKTLAPDETDKRFREQFSFYLATGKPVEKLTICYSEKLRSGKEQERSYLIGRILRLFDGMEAHFHTRRRLSGVKTTDRMEYIDLLRRKAEGRLSGPETERCRVLAGVFPEIEESYVREQQGREKLPQELIDRLQVRVSVSRMEAYAKCPYAYFLRYILRLGERKRHELKEYDIGNILHRTLELVFTEVRDGYGNDWNKLGEEDQNRIVQTAVRQSILEEKPYLTEEDLSTGKTELTVRELDRMARENVEILKLQVRDGKMLPELFEQPFEAEFTAEGPSGREETIQITGVVDRIDTDRSEDGTVFLKIVDYKTGDKKLDLRDVRDGRNLQLSVYFRILTEIFSGDGGMAVPAGLYYYHLDQPVLKELKANLLKTMSEEKAAGETFRQECMLRGIPNISPAGEESKLPAHYIAELQETGTVNASRQLENGKTIPVKVTKDHVPSAAALLATTEDLISFGDYSLFKMKELTGNILSGRVEKYPTRKAGDQKDSCDYCAAAAVCRFRKGETPDHIVGKAGDSRILLQELCRIGKDNPVELRKACLKEKLTVEERMELLDEDTDDDEGEDE